MKFLVHKVFTYEASKKVGESVLNRCCIHGTIKSITSHFQFSCVLPLPQALLQAGVQILAYATASWVGLFHKVGELALADALRWSKEDTEETLELVEVAERLVR